MSIVGYRLRCKQNCKLTSCTLLVSVIQNCEFILTILSLCCSSEVNSRKLLRILNPTHNCEKKSLLDVSLRNLLICVIFYSPTCPVPCGASSWFRSYPLPTLLPEASAAVAKRTPEPYTGEYVRVSFN